jgi:hypothetical protein
MLRTALLVLANNALQDMKGLGIDSLRSKGRID